MTYEQYLAQAVAVQKKVFALTAPNKKEINSFLPDNPPTKKTLADGTVYCNDIEYGRTYPNSFLDIWYSAESSAKKPTVIYAHGGGYLFGDKIAGDPLAVKSGTDLLYYHDLAQRGYNVVSVNYCFAPNYKAPAQIIQYNEMLAFLDKNADRLNLDMDNVVLMGGSAGANFSAIMGLALCDKEYAGKLGFVPAIKRNQIKALVIDEMSLTQSVNIKSEGMITLCAAWLGTVDLLNDKTAKLLDVAANVKEDYIPAYLTASNVEPWFYESASALYNKLLTMGVPCKLWYKPKEESCDLQHGFMNKFDCNSFAKECYDEMLNFIKIQLR